MSTSIFADETARDRPLRESVRFRFAFRRALWRLRLQGRITPREQRRYWLAAVTMERFEADGKSAFLIEHLHNRCERIAQASGDFLDDLSDWWNRLVAWLVENWDAVLKVLLSLLVFLETPQDASEAFTN